MGRCDVLLLVSGGTNPQKDLRKHPWAETADRGLHRGVFEEQLADPPPPPPAEVRPVREPLAA